MKMLYSLRLTACLFTFSALSAAATVTISGSTSAARNAGIEFDLDSFDHPFVPGGPVSDGVISTVTGASAEVFANAGVGQLQLFARAQGDAVAPGNTNQGAASVSGGWLDDITVTGPGPLGSWAMLRVTVLMSSAFAVTGVGSDGYVHLAIGGGETPATIHTYTYIVGQNPTGNANLLNGSLTAELWYRVGQQSSLSVTLSLSANALPGDGSARSSNVDFSHTLAWGGFQMFDENGVPITGGTVVSGSGFNYASSSVPEPSTAGLAAGALALGGWLLRRRK